MTDTVDATEDNTFLDPNIRTPEMEMAETGGGVPAAAELDIDDIRRNVALFPGRCYELNYEDLVREPYRYFRETLDFCELPWDAEFERVIERTGIRDYGDRWKQQIPADEAVRIQEFFDRVESEQAEPAPTCTAS